LNMWTAPRRLIGSEASRPVRREAGGAGRGIAAIDLGGCWRARPGPQKNPVTAEMDKVERVITLAKGYRSDAWSGTDHGAGAIGERTLPYQRTVERRAHRPRELTARLAACCRESGSIAVDFRQFHVGYPSAYLSVHDEPVFSASPRGFSRSGSGLATGDRRRARATGPPARGCGRRWRLPDEA